jgi:L-ribulose-5-phosphate 4-epimerase
MIDEGYVKFAARWERGPAPLGIEDLVAVRNGLHAMGLIGEYVEVGIGYGNVSKRIGDSQRFTVSGTATGNIAMATADHFSEVREWSIEENSVSCIGPVAASSESLTHAMLYACDPRIGAVLHVHHRGFWEHLLRTRQSTGAGIAYGTPAMAMEMARLLKTPGIWEYPIIAMAGHEEGIVAFGGNLHTAMEKLKAEYEKNWEGY